MTELKTLKDLEGKWGTKPNKQAEIIFRELKAEAAKWVKEVRGIFIENDGKLNIAYGIETAMAIGWIKDFFNLTEEDLKNEN